MPRALLIHPCIGRRVPLARRIYPSHALFSPQVSCQDAPAMIQYLDEMQVLCLRVEPTHLILLSTPCESKMIRGFRIKLQNSAEITWLTEGIQNPTHLGGSIELIISSSFDNPSAVDLMPVLLGSIPTNKGASYFISDSGGDTPSSAIFR